MRLLRICTVLIRVFHICWRKALPGTYMGPVVNHNEMTSEREMRQEYVPAADIGFHNKGFAEYKWKCRYECGEAYFKCKIKQCGEHDSACLNGCTNSFRRCITGRCDYAGQLMKLFLVGLKRFNICDVA